MTADVVCASGVPVLMDYLEGALPPGEVGRLEGHVAGCERCRAFVRSYVETPAILRRATLPEGAPEVEPFWRRRP